MPRIREVQTDRTLYPLESEVLGYLPEFEMGTKRALVTGVEAAAIALEVTTGIKNFAVNSPGYYRKWMGSAERELQRRYFKHMAERPSSYAELSEVA